MRVAPTLAVLCSFLVLLSGSGRIKPVGWEAVAFFFVMISGPGPSSSGVSLATRSRFVLGVGRGGCLVASYPPFTRPRFLPASSWVHVPLPPPGLEVLCCFVGNAGARRTIGVSGRLLNRTRGSRRFASRPPSPASPRVVPAGLRGLAEPVWPRWRSFGGAQVTRSSARRSFLAPRVFFSSRISSFLTESCRC